MNHVGAQPNITVTIDGSPMGFVDQPPVDQAGRIFVPMRAIFERLGATVVYDNGTINATRDRRTISLTIGSPTATVNGQQLQLDSPPFEIAGRTLVPLRFVSQALGARVDWNENRLTASIMTGGMTGGMPGGYQPQGTTPQYQTQYSGSQYGEGANFLRNTYPMAQTPRVYPPIGASFDRPLQPQTVRVRLDGQDVTADARIRPDGFQFTPSYRLSGGTHTVRVTGIAQDGRPVSQYWTFTVVL
jgi:hypothetical protein